MDDKALAYFGNEIEEYKRKQKFKNEVWDLVDPETGESRALEYCALEPWKLRPHTMKLIYDNFAQAFIDGFGSDEKLWHCIFAIMYEWSGKGKSGTALDFYNETVKELNKNLAEKYEIIDDSNDDNPVKNQKSKVKHMGRVIDFRSKVEDNK